MKFLGPFHRLNQGPAHASKALLRPLKWSSKALLRFQGPAKALARLLKCFTKALPGCAKALLRPLKCFSKARIRPCQGYAKTLARLLKCFSKALPGCAKTLPKHLKNPSLAPPRCCQGSCPGALKEVTQEKRSTKQQFLFS